MRREHEPRRAPAAAELEELRAQLRAAQRRRDAVTLAAVLLTGGLVWLAAARAPAWPGWLLLAAGLARLAYGAWR